MSLNTLKFYNFGGEAEITRFIANVTDPRFNAAQVIGELMKIVDRKQGSITEDLRKYLLSFRLGFFSALSKMQDSHLETMPIRIFQGEDSRPNPVLGKVFRYLQEKLGVLDTVDIPIHYPSPNITRKVTALNSSLRIHSLDEAAYTIGVVTTTRSNEAGAPVPLLYNTLSPGASMLSLEMIPASAAAT